MDYTGTRGVPRLDLGAALLEFIQEEKAFIGTQLFPVFKSPEKKANYPAITRASLTQTADTKRGSKGNYNRGSMGAKDKSFACEENGFEMPLSDDDRALYKTDFDAEWASTKGAGGILLRNQEGRIATKAFSTSTFTGSALYTDNSGTPWATIGTDIVGQVIDGKEKVRKNCGIEPNALVLSKANVNKCLKNTAIKAAISYTARPTEAEIINALKDLFGVKKLLIGNAVKNSAKEGAVFSGDDIWNATHVLLAVVAEDGQDLTQPSIGRTFLWDKDCPENVHVESYRDEPIRSDIFRARSHTDEVLIDPYFGHLLKVA